MKLIDADALLGIVKQHHDFFSGAMLQADKARRDELSQVMADIVNAPAVDAIPVEWLEEQRNRVAHLPRGGKQLVRIVDGLLAMWCREQEGRDCG